MKNTADSAADEYDQVHRSRSFKSWTGRDGAFCFSGRVTTDAGAALAASIEERKAKHVKAARAAGRREPFEAYAADALVELVTEDRGAGAQGTRPKTMVVVHVSYDAMVRATWPGARSARSRASVLFRFASPAASPPTRSCGSSSPKAASPSP